ncbi:zinc finger protein family member / Fip1 [Leishmania donovani]|uniref:Fip1_motif/Zinc_finger_C-x8-C-x5-C-x3-H_type_(And _similar)_-_putative n=3 Tax=Leishmania donovani species complex TaxID=38574 RepID=A0A6L0WS18_LEIIN|nr:conserved hypothetical protein [Leishmania infantum JPCM5]CAC9442881.1 Fip1_motif/Zinc_finger_C-x8-C-x5-C-x3-H_type_(and_similar)_-_putative [Leishmania infantum]CAJ1985990.1 zinc finger protein family member / Fip1 [Leishmania donovani]CAM65320.1 conserved hypothetical protein [Leishmania infantum JPCM5]SUZ38939.1 Fip1_motif/Zinc_finger_C-x8-C-x5-C-x3-H_type_(and_similar)_-_putative [Leishmania infantum]VDZ41892.1 Fip1_motif/Zinc_finger_C-x8-C-x5-C-x3-H_type_(and_similar)_putative/Pfam:PF0|eukprot:XP_001462974.1 conserved hypothetical protein [Leishmania infantum JPCM5]
MEAGGDDLFVINDVEADQMEEVRDARPVEQAQETEAEAMESVKGLVPLCAQHAQGPQLSSATFGYDIALMAKRPWAEPGAKLSDYFNYGFNEQSWRVYCAMQEKGEESLLANATAMLQKLELAARPGAGAAAEAGAGGHAAPDEPPMLMFGGIMDGYSDGGPYVGGHGMYGGQEGPGRGGGYGRPYQPREFHQHGGGGFERLHNANYKTRLCKSFAEGHCNRGDQCNFAHGVGELRQPGGGEPIPPPPPQQHMPQQLPPAGLAGGGSAPPPMAQIYGDHRPGFNSYYTPPPPQVMSGGAPPQAPERLNYLMPPFQGGAGMPPMMEGPAMPMQDSGDGAGSGFRQPPKRPRQDGDGVYEPQY